MIATPAPAAPPVAALAVSPARVLVRASATAVVRVANPGASAVDVRATRAGYAVAGGGRPVLDGRRPPPAGWLFVSRTHFRLRAHAVQVVRVRAGMLAGARPGDHSVLLLFAATPARARRVAVALRIGVVVTLRAPGAVRRRLAIGRVRVDARGGAVRVTVANVGDLDEWLGRNRLTVVVRRGARVVARLHPRPQRILARTSRPIVFSVPRRLHGRHTLTVVVGQARAGAAPARRTVGVAL